LQHFEEIRKWKNNPDVNRYTDVYKMKCALENGISVIRILQEDVYYNRYDWKTALKKELYKRDTPEVVYLDNGDNIYYQHKRDMNNFEEDYFE